MARFTRIGVFLLCAGSVSAFAGQSCDSKAYPLSTPTERFTDNGDGTVTDTGSKMTWMRCALGQQWTGTSCTGTAQTLSWQAAQEAAKELNAKGGYAKHADWRMPHIPELAMIVERQCANPRINLGIFPGTPATYFWTATARRGPGLEAEAYRLSFGPEGASPDKKVALHLARLVRVGS